MSIEKVRAYFRSVGMEDRVMEFPVSSAPVDDRLPQLFRFLTDLD